MSSKVNVRDAAGSIICRLSAWAKKQTVSSIDLDMVEAKLLVLKETWTKYTNLHDGILDVCGSETIKEQIAIAEPIEDEYVNTLAKLSALLKLLKPGPSRPPPSITATGEITSATTLLPRVNIPTFSGGYVEWQSFEDLYVALVHDKTTLSKIEKFHHLKSALTGEAANIIRHITITEANYDTAWNELKIRYTNKRIIVSQLLAKLINQQCHSDNVNCIKGLLDTTKQCLDMLTNLNRPTNLWDDIIVYVIVEKLPKYSRHLWETSLADSTTPATWQQLETFLRTRFRTLEASSGLSATGSTGASSKLVSSKSFSINSVTKLICSFCGEPHAIARCENYLGAPVNIRRQHVHDHKLCFNCLHPHHTVSECTSNFRCNQCDRLHHSTLHQQQQMNSNNNKSSNYHQSSTNASNNYRTNNNRFNYGRSSMINNRPPTLSSNVSTSTPSYQGIPPLYKSFVPASKTPQPTSTGNSVATNVTTTSCINQHTNLSSTNVSSNVSTTPTYNVTSSLSTYSNINNKCAAISTAINATTKLKSDTVLLATAQVNATGGHGNVHMLRVLIDQGSQISLITEHAATMLNVKRKKSTLDIVPVGHGSPIAPKGVTSVTLSSIYDNTSITAELYVLPNITTVLPTTTIQLEYSIELPSPLADPHWTVPSTIDILLGADAYHKIMKAGIKKCHESMLAQDTIFGWILSGQLNDEHIQQRQICSHITTIESIDNLLRKFWEISDDSTMEHSSNDEIKFIEQHFDTTHQRLPSGRYQVRLPFRSLMTGTPDVLGNSLSGAISRLYQIERRNLRDPNLHKEYVKFMNNYEETGHMTEIPNNNLHQHASGINYLPHHAVFKPSSTSTKVRVVFDGSHKPPSGTSLNESLLVGPTLQAKLVDTLQRWRTFQYVLCADIKQMYRQILIHPDDQDYQRIVWRESSNDIIKHFKLNTVTYGTSSAPYLAVRTLRQLAIDEAGQFPLASNATLSQFYVDDLLSGANDVSTAIKLRNELKHLLQSGGFELLKWSSNNDEILSTISERERQCQFPLALNLNETITTLGIIFDPSIDTFGFNITDNFNHHDSITKRQLLSEASKLFDPIGWLEPVTIVPKIIMQKLWLLKLNWDEAIPESIVRNWNTYRNSLTHLSTLKIKRWTGSIDNNRTHQLHGFSDASSQAYGAVVYLRTCNIDNEPTISLIAARSRVAPIKTVSIPRLELTAATLLADLMHQLCSTVFSTTNLDVYAWCDSQITLAWLKSPPSRWKVFICNRTSRILTKLPECRFGYIKSADNPADLISRGMCPSKMKGCDKWWQGPTWLIKPSHLWPATVPESVINHIDNEERKTVNVTIISQEWEVLCRFSSWTKLIRTTVHIQRFLKKLNNKQLQLPNAITTVEMNDATVTIIQHVQRTSFNKTIESIKNSPHRCISRALASLNPFIDQREILRVGGRLHRANIPFDQQHPIILPSNSHVSQLIVNHVHHQTLHGNIQLMLTTIRMQYWIIRVRSIVKRTIRNCTICQRMRAAIRTPMMSDLPASRVNESLPFTHTAVDYAGPIQTKATTGRGRKQILKGYICVFVCLATKAIHLEAVTSLTSEAFIAAFRRFISRRGLCSHVYSDCGTNFKGAYRIINEYNKIYRDSSPTFINNKLNWHFSPPGAPHFNGLAEAGVKSVKKHLNRVIGNVTLTYEELATILCQIEACLNSRPLCAVKDDPTQEILTPGHFLIGRPPLQLPDPTELQNSTIINRWHLVQKLTRDVWCQWHKEYLNELQQRHKWQNNIQQVQPSIDDIVIIKDENLSPLKWPMGRIIQLHTGDDNVTRVVTVKTESSIMKRPVVKLCWLPTHSS